MSETLPPTAAERAGSFVGSLSGGLDRLKKFKDKKVEEFKNARAERIEKDKQETIASDARTAVADRKFHEVLANSSGFDEQREREALEPEKHPDTALFIAERYAAYKVQDKVKAELKALYRETMARELEGKNTTTEQLPEEVLKLIESEVDHEVRENPTGVTKLLATALEHKANLKKIQALEEKQEKMGGNSHMIEHFAKQVEIVNGLNKKQLENPHTLTHEEQTALREVNVKLGGGNDLRGLVKGQRFDAKTIQRSVAEAVKTESDLDDLEQDIAATRKSLFEESAIGKALAAAAKKRSTEKYKAAMKKAEKGDLAAAEEALSEHLQRVSGQSELGINWSTYNKTRGTKLAKLEKLIQENFAQEMFLAAEGISSGDMDRIFSSPVFRRTKVGTLKGKEFSKAFNEAVKAAHKKLKAVNRAKAFTFLQLLNNHNYAHGIV